MQECASNEQYLHALLDASIVSKSDRHGKIIYANENFCKIAGYTLEEMLGKSHNIFRHPDNPDEIYKDMWDTIKSGKVWRGRMKNLNKGGSTFIADSTIIPLFNKSGEIIEYMAIRTDITNEVKLLEEVIHNEQEKIREQQVKDAEKAFLLVFTHELKTPLNAIINFSKYIKKRVVEWNAPQSEKLVELLDGVLENASEMLENIVQILEVSKLNAGQLEYDKKLVHVNQLVKSIEKKYSALIQKNGIKVSYSMDQELFVYSDEYRLNQIISNILSNAIKYGKNQIEIKLESNAQESRIVIEDNGPGIKNKEEVFGLFVQEGVSSTQRKAKGTGVGLYFVKLLCEHLDIAYKIEDRDPDAKDERGVRFLLTFKNRQSK